MTHFVYGAMLLAEAGGAAPKESPLAQYAQFLPLVAIVVLFYFLILRPQGKEKQQRQDLLSALKKNDKVITIGGLIGTVANLSPDGKEVTLKVDDNTKLRFLRSSIQTVVTAESTDTETTLGKPGS